MDRKKSFWTAVGSDDIVRERVGLLSTTLRCVASSYTTSLITTLKTVSQGCRGSEQASSFLKRHAQKNDIGPAATVGSLIL